MRAVLRLVLASMLFAGWIGYLVYLVCTASKPVVLSRPQFLVADLDVIARIDDPQSKKAVVKEVYWARDGARTPATDSTITIDNLDQCKDPRFAWSGPGEYILPLRQPKEGVYEVAHVPSSPGYAPDGGDGAVRIYRDTVQARQQLQRLKPQ